MNDNYWFWKLPEQYKQNIDDSQMPAEIRKIYIGVYSKNATHYTSNPEMVKYLVNRLIPEKLIF